MESEVPGRREIPIRELPGYLTEAVHRKIRRHAVSMVLPPVGDAAPRCCSGTLVRLNEMDGILTARHVWTAIAGGANLALLVGGAPYYLDRRVLRGLGPKADATLPDGGASVPDIVFVRLPPRARGDIEASDKVFYSVDLRRAVAGIDILDGRGLWILAGSPQALAKPDTGMVASFLYDTTMAKHTKSGGWDYLLVNLDLPENPSLPRTYGGVSGGGVWRVLFSVSEDNSIFSLEDEARDIILSGVAFYQTELEGRQIIAHGPTSVYRILSGHLSDLDPA